MFGLIFRELPTIYCHLSNIQSKKVSSKMTKFEYDISPTVRTTFQVRFVWHSLKIKIE